MNNLEMIPVQSSNIAAIGYDEGTETLYVRFIAGTLYTYKGVPKIEFENLLNAPSIGSYLNRNFKGIYPYEREE